MYRTGIALTTILAIALCHQAHGDESEIIDAPADDQLKIARTTPDPALYGPAYLLSMAAKPKKPYGDTSRVLNDRFQIMLGGYWPQLETEIRVDAINGLLGTTISLEDNLGYRNDVVVPRGDFLFRFGDRRKHRFEFSWYQIDRDGTQSLQADINIGDTTYPASATVNSTFDFSLYRAAYGWSFLKKERGELGLLLGLHVTDLDFAINGVTIVGDDTSQSDEDAGIALPLPTGGFFGAYAITPRLVIDGRVQVFYIEFDEYSGGLLNAQARIQYDVHKNVGLGIGWEGFFTQIEAEDDIDEIELWHGQVDFNFHGPVAFINIHFGQPKN